MLFRCIRIVLIFISHQLIGQEALFADISDVAGTGMGANNNGIIVGDYDNDGFEDLFVPANSSSNRIFKNMGDGTFQDVTTSTGIETGGFTKTGAWGDIDNDGDLDLFIGNFYTTTFPYHNYLYLNNGDGTFTDISESANVDTFNKTRSAHMVDVNLDGYLDIYLCNLTEQNILWTNNGDNTFTNTVFTAGLLDNLISMGAIFFDYDNDGDQDVYLTHDAYQPNIMYENNGNGVYTNVSAATGLNLGGQGMGVDHGDINNDGHLDIYVTNLGANFLFLNDGNGHFTEIAESAGVDDPGMGWGCFFLDYDNDGWEDIYVVNDYQFTPVPNKLYHNNADSTFTIVSENTVLSSFNNGKGGIWADLNNDGYPEIIVANNDEDAGVQIFQNDHTSNNWIGFYLEGIEDAHDACGARIQVNTINGTKIDEVTCGSSYASMSSRRIYFGLGSGGVSEISIRWPNGTTDYFETLNINEIHTIEQGISMIDLDADGFNAYVDCDDSNGNIHPEMHEVPYNGWDDDCNVLTPDDDIDGDGYTLAFDCDDTNDLIHPDATEQAYNGQDDDCNPLTPDDDIDGDGYLSMEDCDDTNNSIYPGNFEIVYNGQDDDCDALTPDDDIDGDGFVFNEDCDDTNNSIFPGNSETVYNGIDDDCTGDTPDDDIDGDGFVLSEDCDDTNDGVYPGGVEIANNGVDEDCDGDDLIISVSEMPMIEIELYPNPARGEVWIRCNLNLFFDTRIVDMTGRTIAVEKTRDNLDLADIPAGIYTVIMSNSELGLHISKRLEVFK